MIVLLSSLAGTLQAQLTRFVKQGGTGDGSTWTNAAGDLQAMMNAAANGGTVYVAGGTYYPTTSTDRNKTFLFPQAGNVKLIGGYNAATGIRNITANATILSGDIGVPGNDADNSYHVLVIANTDANADSIIIDGFTVTKGQADGTGIPINYNAVGIQNSYGGGICVVVGGNVAIRNTIISNNKAGFGGGGMFNQYSSPLIADCSVVSNEVIYNNNYLIYGYYGGGGIYNKYAAPQITRTSIKLNKGFRGAGMVNYAGTAKLNNCLFDANIADGLGGATYNYSPGGTEQSLPVFTNCEFINNRAVSGGVGYDNDNSSPTYTNCVFYSNSAVGGSGGDGSCFFGYESEFLTLNNCVFSGNVSSGNYTIHLLNSSIRIRNSIIYGNTNGTDIYIQGSSWNSEIGNSLIGSVRNDGGVTINYLPGNLIGSFNPQFTNAANAVGADGIWGTADDGLQLQSMSPGINTGSNSLIPGGITTDITGAQRIQAGTVDMGAYETPFIINCGFSTLYVDGTRASSGQGDSWATAFKTVSEAMERARFCSTVNTIMIAKGTYYATGGQNGSNRDSAFLIPQRGGIKLYGGYPNGGGTRNINANPTILSGDIGVPGNNSDNSYHVLVMTETLPGADSVVIDGFTITGANANGGSYYYNNALTNQNEGGAILLRKNSNAATKIAIRNCNIVSNSASNWGAGIYTWESSALINNCVIANNTATEGGGGVFGFGTASPGLVNCLFSGNSAKNGAAVYNNGATLAIVNSTFSGNAASLQGSSIYNTGTSATSAVNTILWNNGTNTIYNSASLNITYSNVEQGSGVYSGTGNINADPLFVNSANAAGSDGNWRTADDGLKLQAGSAAINAGTPDVSGLSLNPFDLQGSARLLVNRIDMGAYESPYINCSEGTNGLYVDGSVSQSGNGISWANAFKTLTEALNTLNVCSNIKTIYIAKGTYYPSASSNRDDAFIIPQRGNVQLYGGYPTGGGTRDVLANPTILSGDIGALNNNTDNSYHVMVITNINVGADSVLIDGLSFTNANANGSGSNSINQASLSRTTGGGLVLINTNNNSKIAIRNCRFVHNRATQGAGIYISASSPRIINSYVQGNFSTDNGGGVSNYNLATPTLINVVISGNQASFAGAVFNDNSSPTFINATITDNYASAEAGGLYNRYTSTNVNFFNSIIYGNRRPDGTPSNIYNITDGKTTLAYSLIESATSAWDPAFGTNNGNNLFSDPLFAARVNPTSGNTPNTSGNYQLQSGSPVIDAGDNTSIPADINTDVANATRLQHAWVDMGALESPYFNCSMFTDSIAKTAVKCYGDATGMATVILNKGEAPFTYSWSNGATIAGLNNIVAGNYSGTVTDANGCSIIKNFTIAQPAAVLAATTSFTNIKCFGDNSGSAAINVTGGTTPYVYSWSNGSTLANLTALAAGTYSCTVTDANGCTVTKAIIITQPAVQLDATPSKTDVLCYNNNTGAASVQVTGGDVPYSYLWSTGATVNAISGVTAGTYTCTITDANGCSLPKQMIITQPVAALAATGAQTNILCYNSNTGSATVTISGGTTPYTYSWSNGGITPAISNVTAGTYVCTVTDANGCTVVKSIIITQPAAALAAAATQTNILCYNASSGSATVTISGGTVPYSYSWSNGGAAPAINNVTAGTYVCTVTDAKGCSVVKSFTITQPAAALTVARSQTNILCYNANTGSATVTVSGGTAPYSYNWSNGGATASINNVTAGIYTCTVKDANGCSVVESFTITQPVAALAVVRSQINILCYNANTGSATVTVSGGTAPYTYSWSNGGVASAINNVTAGTYSCTITDVNGCVRSETFIISQPPALTMQVSKTDVYCGAGNTGGAAIQVNGGVTPYVYLWSNGSSTPAINGLVAGSYSCIITDVNGCTVDTSVSIVQTTFSGNKIYVDSAVAVSGDGSNWANAFRYLSDAMVVAGCPGVDSILVAKGTYYPTGNPADANRDSTFLLPQDGGLKLIGGYPSGGGARDIGANITTLSGELSDPSDGDNAYHVMVIAGIGSGADSVVVDGFVVQRGYASSGGVYYYNGIAVTQQSGSAIYLSNNNDAGRKISIRNCQFTGNFASFKGGAIYNEQSSPVITRCKFFGNQAAGSGGAIGNEFLSGPLITLCEFSNNRITDFGGAIFNAPNTQAIIDQCRFLSNWAAIGGAIANQGSSPVITNCYIAGNRASSNGLGGAGIYNNNASPRIINTYFIGNAADLYSNGSGLCNFNNSSVTVTNCTFSGNGGSSIAVPIYNYASHLSITNSIIYGNSNGIQNVNGATTNVNYSLIEFWGGGGTGNLSNGEDPKFVAWNYNSAPFTDGDYRLQACSPAINAGIVDTTGLGLPAFAMSPELPRVQLGRIDIGAYEANSYTDANAGAIPETLTSTAAFQLRDSTTWYTTGCDTLIAAITGSGSNPLSGNVTVTVNKQVMLLPGTVSRFYEITPVNNPGTASGTITLYYTQAEFTAYNLANSAGIRLPLPDKDDAQMNAKIPNVRIRIVAGTVQTTIIPHTVNWNAGAQRWELTFDVTDFSKYYVFTEIDAALPLRLISFAAKEENCMANISWTTAEEMAVSHFDLEYSSDGASWISVAQIKASNTAGEKKYTTSVSINTAINFYRLKMVDIDGKATYSKMVRVVSPLGCIGQAIQLYPNPASDLVYIEKANPSDSYNFYDNTGRCVLQGAIKKTIQEIDVRKLLPGIYAVFIVNRQGAIQSMKFIKQ
jgi:hypothetical protein